MGLNRGSGNQGSHGSHRWAREWGPGPPRFTPWAINVSPLPRLGGCYDWEPDSPRFAPWAIDVSPLPRLGGCCDWLPGSQGSHRGPGMGNRVPTVRTVGYRCVAAAAAGGCCDWLPGPHGSHRGPGMGNRVPTVRTVGYRCVAAAAAGGCCDWLPGSHGSHRGLSMYRRCRGWVDAVIGYRVPTVRTVGYRCVAAAAAGWML
jgi:hypothetical protein